MSYDRPIVRVAPNLAPKKRSKTVQKEPKLWPRGERGWYVTVGRRQIPLGKDEAEARKEYHRILASEGFIKSDGRMKVSELIHLFLQNSEAVNKPKTVQWHRFFLDSFSKRYGALRVNELKRLHITHWTQEKRKRPWQQNSIRHAMSCVRAAMRFGVSEGYIKEEPVKFKLPPAVRREKFLSVSEMKFIFTNAGRGGFREVLTALMESGARPSEVCSIEARNVDLEKGIWRLDDHKTQRKTGTKIIYLSPALLKICRTLCAEHPTGKIFLNSWGKPWTPDNIRLRFKRMKRQGLDPKAVPYCLRSGFITDALENGVPIATVAELVGHVDTRMISKFYSKLSTRTEHLRNAVEQATKK